MAKRAHMAESPPDDDEAFPPRRTFALVGQGDALSRIARVIRSGKSPQAVLIAGPPGVGKATLAYRVARYLLKYGANDAGPADLAVPENDPVSAQVTARAHPGLLVLKRGLNRDGKPMTVLGVHEVRRLGGFFGMTAGAGGWRVAIVDTADDMNDNAANALLKVLEEPPSRSMLMLLANSPGRLLPTVRSRCQRLDLRPLPLSDVEDELARRMPELSAAERASLAKLSGGSIGAAMRLTDEDGLALATEAMRLIDDAGAPDAPAILALGDRISRMKDGLEGFGGFLGEVLAERIRARAEENAPHLDRWAALRERLVASFGRSSALHLEPRQTILSAARAVAQAARRGAL